MEGDPFVLIEGMVIAGIAVGATRGYIYIRSEYPHATAALEEAIAAAERAGWLGARVGGSGHAFRLEVRVGAGAYVCGEETSLLDSLEGKRGIVRAKPPLPAHKGLFGRPTVINNVLSLAAVPFILAEGGKAYADFGMGRSRGTMPIQLAGNIRHGGLYETAFGVTLGELVEAIGGGTESGRPVRAVQVGGPLGAYFPPALFDTAFDYEAFAAKDGLIGHGGIVVFDDQVDMAWQARFAFDFCAIESCGKCTPCRIGAVRGRETMDRLIAGEDPAAMRALVEDLCNTMKFGSLCALGGFTPYPVLSALTHFPEDFGGRAQGGGGMRAGDRASRRADGAGGSGAVRAGGAVRQAAGRVDRPVPARGAALPRVGARARAVAPGCGPAAGAAGGGRAALARGRDRRRRDRRAGALMLGLKGMAASEAALLLNAEAVFTALIAWVVFRENVDLRVGLGFAAIAAGAVLIATGGGVAVGGLWPSLAVLGACLAWGIDNNLTRRVSLADASWIACVKGLVAGSVNTAIGLALGAALPGAAGLGGALLLGLFAYGVSLTLFVVALRELGAARAGAYFSTAPFFGAVIAVAMGEPLTATLVVAAGLMAAGVWLHLSERHEHAHSHPALEHMHWHTHDLHHRHAVPVAAGAWHRHPHRHEAMTHSHPHYPDAHHRHVH